MGWGLRILVALVGLAALGLGVWPISLLAVVCILFSFRRARREGGAVSGRQKSGGPRGWLVLGGVLLLLSAVALWSGGTFSPIIFALGGTAVILRPYLQAVVPAGSVVPVKESVLLRSKFVPFKWHSLAEVKLESQDQTRGIAALDGRILIFAAKSSAAFQLVTVHALWYRQAEEKVVRTLRRETRALSQRGAHLLPLDSRDASRKLSLTLDRLNLGVGDLGAVSSIPFDVFTLQTKEGLVVKHRVFRISEPEGDARIPQADLPVARPPLFAEVVERIGERYGWPGPDEFSPFLASMDASRAEPMVDRFRARGDETDMVSVETPGGAEVKLTRAQLRAVARIYG